MEWDEAIAVLEEWEGRDVVVVPFLAPGLSLEPTVAPLVLERPAHPRTQEFLSRVL